MLLSLLLLAALDGQTPPPRPSPAPPVAQSPPVGVPTHNQAAAMADAGDLESSLRAFQRIAAANPDDHVARLSIANIQVRMHHPERAESVYRSILLENPKALDARIGVATTLNARRAYKDAMEILAPVENTVGGNAAALAAFGDAHMGLGHVATALGYYERAAAVSPTTENRWRVETTRLRYDHRIEGTGLFERFDSNVSDTRGGDAALNYRLSERFRVSARGQYQEKFNRRDSRGGAGLERAFGPSTWFTAELMAGPDSRVLAQYEGLGQLTWTRHRTALQLGYRYYDFFGAAASVVSAGVQWTVSDRTALDFQFSEVLSRFGNLPYDKNPSVSLHVSRGLTRRVSLLGGYARGVENFHALSVDRLGAFEADTVSAGAAIRLPSLTTVQGDYEYQLRPDGFNMHRFSLGLKQHF